jgi:DNA-binding CsgD family transcriptional regulator
MPLKETLLPDLNAPDPRGCEDDGDPEASPIVGLTADQVLRLRTFFQNWIRMTPAQRDVAALALCGLNGAEIGRRRNCSKQAVSMRLAAARDRSPALAVALAPAERPGPGDGKAADDAT